MTNKNLVQIGRFYHQTQLHIFRGILETHDIECFTFDDGHNSVAWHLSYATGGSRLTVFKNDYERAKSIIDNELEKHPTKTNLPNIKRPIWKTLFGTIMGMCSGAPSIKPHIEDKQSEL